MNIYQKKQQWKIWLSFAAVIIIAASLWYTNQLVKKIAEEERTKVKLWADAVRTKANLVESTEKLFVRLKNEERKRAEMWAEATRNLSITEDDDARSFYLKVVQENNTIPAIIVDDKNLVGYITNFDTAGYGKITSFTGKIKNAFSTYKPIVIPDGFSSTYYIYYQDSRVFNELKEVLDNIIRSFITEVALNSASVPVIISDSSHSHIIASGNMDEETKKDTVSMLSLTKKMASENMPLQIDLPDYGKCMIYYQNSRLLTQLKYYPVIQFVVISLFILLAYFLFNFSRRAEQNQVWVGMSKETAHQLGTPLSSLIGWIEILRMKGIDEETISEINKDIKRLEMVTDRFSKIGSMPELQIHNLELILNESIEYMRFRISSKINLYLKNSKHGLQPVNVKLNVHLFEWVIENLFRNAIDAMEGQKGSLMVEIGEKGNWAFVDITDTGKGIPHSKFRTIFKPGYTSKKRGWGLGLSLSKRIIENYHKGKIFVKNSEQGKGTTFRIMLPK